jgi:hypothetical protein
LEIASISAPVERKTRDAIVSAFHAPISGAVENLGSDVVFFDAIFVDDEEILRAVTRQIIDQNRTERAHATNHDARGFEFFHRVRAAK